MAEKAIATPQPRRRLGLRLRKGASTTPGLRRQVTQLTSTSTPLTENNKKEKATEAVETPRALPLTLKASSTNCRRTGLSRQRKDLSKKRLEFANAGDKTEDQKPVEETKNPIENDWRQRKILELEADIDTWRNGFIAAMDDLQAMMEPRVPKQKLLTQLGIPLEMLQYLDED